MSFSSLWVCSVLFPSLSIDLSTSMKGQSLEDAKRHLLICLNELKKKTTELLKVQKETPNQPLVKFNIIVYGSSYNQLFISSKPITDANLQDATKYPNYFLLLMSFK